MRRASGNQQGLNSYLCTLFYCVETLTPGPPINASAPNRRNEALIKSVNSARLDVSPGSNKLAKQKPSHAFALLMSLFLGPSLLFYLCRANWPYERALARSDGEASVWKDLVFPSHPRQSITTAVRGDR